MENLYYELKLTISLGDVVSFQERKSSTRYDRFVD